MVNTHILKLYGSHPLSAPLDPSQFARIQTEIQIESVEKKDLHDGTFEMIYRAKAIAAVDAEQFGKVIRGKQPKQSYSKQLRAKIYVRGYQEQVGNDEQHYNETMQWFLDNFDVIYPMTKSKL